MYAYLFFLSLSLYMYNFKSRGDITFSIQSQNNKKGLVAAFPCSQTGAKVPGRRKKEPRSLQGGAPPRVPGTIGRGDSAARKCCYQTVSILPRSSFKSSVLL